MTKPLRIGIAQINTTVGGFADNRDKILSSTERARELGVDLLVFPELAVTGYPPEDLLFKDDFIRENIASLEVILKKAGDIALLVGFVDRDANRRIYNAAALVLGSRRRATYHKMCLPNYGVFDEKRYFAEGKGPLLLRTPLADIAVSICEDIWLARGAYMSSLELIPCDILVNLSASPYHFGKQREREAMIRERALRLGAFVIYANLVGGQDELVFDGSSFIANPRGEIIGRARRFHEDLLVQDIEIPAKKKPRMLERHAVKVYLRAKQYPRVELPRPLLTKDFADPVAEVYEALCLGTRDYVTKNRFEKVVVGLSGGIDSSLVAAIAADAIGSAYVVGVTMPSRFTSKGTLRDARRLARNLGISCLEIPIRRLHWSYLEALSPFFRGARAGIAEENLQARIRGNILMALSNKFGYLVLTTGNKSEIATGYCTLYGDMAGGFAVIKDVPKTMVYRLARYRNKVAGRELIPFAVLRRPPSAELKPGQKDSDSLPPYPVLDAILESYIEDDMPLARIRARAARKTIQHMIRRVDLNEYKRRQGPIGIKITPKAFGRDRRMPITNRYYLVSP